MAVPHTYMLVDTVPLIIIVWFAHCAPLSYRLWSDPGSWLTGAVPKEGEDVIISSRWRMLLDINPPPLGNVYVFGELLFEDQRDYQFTANLVGIHY